MRANLPALCLAIFPSIIINSVELVTGSITVKAEKVCAFLFTFTVQGPIRSTSTSVKG